MVREPRDNI